MMKSEIESAGVAVAKTLPVFFAKRPRPVVRVVKDSDLDWTPTTLPLFTVDATTSKPIRAGESFAIVREGYERWPLGIVSDHYKLTAHNTTIANLLQYASAKAKRIGPAIMSGHGYHVAHCFKVEHLRATSVKGAPITTRLLITHDHTGAGALRASMVVYVDNLPLGSVVNSRALHAGSQPTRWEADIDSMTERAILAQDALVDLLAIASETPFTEADRKFFKNRKMIIRGKGDSMPATVLDAVKSWHRGYTKKLTWGVWERRLDDTAIKALCVRFGKVKFGRPLDEALGGYRYGGPVVAAAEVAA